MAFQHLTGVKKRVNTLTVSTNTYTPNADSTDIALITNPAAAFTIANQSGTVIDGQSLILRIKATAAYAITWGTNYQSSGIATLPTTTVANKTITVGLTYDSAAGKLVALTVDPTGY